MSKKSTRQSNDQRATDRNPNSTSYQRGQDNRSRQLNPEHPTYHSSRKKG